MTAARDLLHPRMATLHRELLLRVEEISGRAPEAVHQCRVTCRRLVAALGSFGLLLDPMMTRPARAELRWAARALGVARDTEVVHARLARLMDELGVAVDGPERARLGERYRAGEAAARDRVSETITSQRFADLLAAVEGLVLDPPWTPEADHDAATIARTVVRRDFARLERRAARLGATTAGRQDAGRQDAALHDVRKAAKRLRYTGETVEPVRPEEARWLVGATLRITRLLGERQDTVLSRSLLGELAASAVAAGESAGRFEQLRLLEEARAAECEVAFGGAWRDLAHSPRWTWLE